MTWMLTYTGAQFDLLHADPLSISLLDIAAALAKVNRFHGHTCRLYSVAEHSLHVCNLMEREHGITSPAGLLAGLMHDAHEAYTGDAGTPLKQALDSQTDGGWSKFEARVAGQVLQRFKLRDTMLQWRDEVKRADLQMLATERRDLMPSAGPAWPSLDGILTSRDLHLHHHDGMDWADWRDAFVDRFAELQTQCKAHGMHAGAALPHGWGA